MQCPECGSELVREVQREMETYTCHTHGLRKARPVRERLDTAAPRRGVAQKPVDDSQWAWGAEYFADTHEVLVTLRSDSKRLTLDAREINIIRRFHVPNPTWARVRDDRTNLDEMPGGFRTHRDQTGWKKLLSKELLQELTQLAVDLHREMCADAPQDAESEAADEEEAVDGPSVHSVIEAELAAPKPAVVPAPARTEPRRRVARPLYPLAARLENGWTLIRPISQYWYRKAQWEFVDPWKVDQGDLHPRIQDFIEHSQDCPLYVFQIESRRDYAKLVEYPPTGARILVLLHPEASILRTSEGVDLQEQQVEKISEYDAYEVTLEDGEAIYVSFRDEEIVLTPIEPPTVTGDCYREDATNEYIVFRPWIRVAFPVPINQWQVDISPVSELDESDPEVSIEAEPGASEVRIDLSTLSPRRYRAAIVAEEEGTVGHVDIHWRPDVRAIKRDELRYLPQMGGHGPWGIDIVRESGTERITLEAAPFSDEIVHEFEPGNPLSQHVFHAPRTWWRWRDASGRTEYTDWPLELKRSQIVPHTRIEFKIPWTKRRGRLTAYASTKHGAERRPSEDHHPLAIKRGRSDYWRMKMWQLASSLNTLHVGDTVEITLELDDETCTIARILVDNDTFPDFEIDAENDSEEDDEDTPVAEAPVRSQAAHAPVQEPIQLDTLQWHTVSDDGVLDHWSETILLRAEDLTATSETTITIHLPSRRSYLELNIGGAGVRRIHAEPGGTEFVVRTRTLTPPEQAVATQGRVPVNIGLGAQTVTVAEIPSRVNERRSRWHGFHFRKIRDIDLVEFHQVAHAAEKGAKFADHFKDAALARLFREIYTDARGLALEGDAATTKWEEEQLRQVLVCLYELLYQTYLFSVDYSQSRELKKWVRAARDNVKHLEQLYEVTREEYEKMLGGTP